MIPPKVEENLLALTRALDAAHTTPRLIVDYWASRGRDPDVILQKDVQAACDALDAHLPGLTRSKNGSASLCQAFGREEGSTLLIWCRANVERSDVKMAALLAAAIHQPQHAAQARDIARKRIVQGPLEDALSCAPLLGTGDQLSLPENAEAQARLEILIWEAGASSLQMPGLGEWIFGSELTFDALIAVPATGSLRGRVLAARCLELCALGLPSLTRPEMLGRTLQVLQPLLLHPEPLVSLHAARALGLIATTTEHLDGMLLDWIGGESLVLRKRAITAATVLPSDKMGTVRQHVVAALADPATADWALAAAAASTPYLFKNNRELWDNIFDKIISGAGGPQAALEMAKGIAALWRRETNHQELEKPWSDLRYLARHAKKSTPDDYRTYLAVLAITDPVDGAERDPLDVELGLENLVHLAAQYDDEEADARAARFASSLGHTFEEARTLALSQASLRHRAAGMNALEGCARSMALRLWKPQLQTRPRGGSIPPPDLSSAWDRMAKAPAELLELVEERRDGLTPADADTNVALEILAVRLGGYVLDACGEDTDLGPGRGPTAHATCLWLRKLEGLTDGSRPLPGPLQDALSAVFWRLVDTTRGTALGAVDDIEWLGPFAAWWALVIDRPQVLQQLTTALPMIKEGALERCCSLADQIRMLVTSGQADGAWGAEAKVAIQALCADNTELAECLLALADVLGKFSTASGRTQHFEALCLELVIAAERLQAALADPVKALHPPGPPGDDSLSRAMTENAPRVASLVARSVRARELGMLDVWFTSLGPITSALVEAAIRGAKDRTPPLPPSRRRLEPETIEGYELVKPLGEGGIGKVWLVRKPGADRLFVLKIPKVEALTNASDTERAGILASFVEEARAMAELYHPNVVSIIDRGVSGDVPFLVLELLIGADLQQYSRAKLMSLFELRPVVLDACAGLSALHGAHLVHRDIKPANIWLRLPLNKGESFDPTKHRDPGTFRPLNAAIIDFGMVRPTRVAPDAAGKFVAGTPGYIAPDQVLDPVELDGRADVYALAGTVYNVTTGRTFFDDISNPRDRIFAHMKQPPLEDGRLLPGYPAELIKLMRAATALDPNDRPRPVEFGRAFEASI
jgi:serine/threonine-protein kinase